MASIATAQTNQSKIQLLILVLIFFLPLFAAMLVYYFSEDIALQGKNSGTLLSTHIPFKSLGIPGQKQKPAYQQLTDGRWTLIYLTPGLCTEHCEHNLLKLEQIRQALGKDYAQTQLLLLMPHLALAEKTVSSLDKQPHVPNAIISNQGLNQLLVRAGVNAAKHKPQYFLADNKGNIIMHYTAPINQQAVYDDLRWLLKVNRKLSITSSQASPMPTYLSPGKRLLKKVFNQNRF
jgi:hypothetical protein